MCCLSMKTNRLYLGTEGGNIYLLDINSFELQEYIIYQDVVMQRLVWYLWHGIFFVLIYREFKKRFPSALIPLEQKENWNFAKQLSNAVNPDGILKISAKKTASAEPFYWCCRQIMRLNEKILKLNLKWGVWVSKHIQKTACDVWLRFLVIHYKI